MTQRQCQERALNNINLKIITMHTVDAVL